MQNEEMKRGDSNEITRAYFDRLLIEMRHLDNKLPDTRVEIFGRRADMPITTAAFSHMRTEKMDGMVELAKGAAACNAINMCGMGDEAELERILATGAPTIKIIKPYADRKRVEAKIDHARESGVIALGIDIDHSMSGEGEYDNVFGDPMAPLTLEELKRYVKRAKLPFVIKGVMSVTDARKCLEAGVSGIVVSHHHGIIPYCVPPLMALPDIAEVVKGRMRIFLDCGISDGSDAFKALALGADAVCVGRAIVPSLHAEGAEGVAAYLNRMNAQLKGIMARTGFARPAEIEPSILHRL